MNRLLAHGNETILHRYVPCLFGPDSPAGDKINYIFLAAMKQIIHKGALTSWLDYFTRCISQYLIGWATGWITEVYGCRVADSVTSCDDGSLDDKVGLDKIG